MRSQHSVGNARGLHGCAHAVHAHHAGSGQDGRHHGGNAGGLAGVYGRIGAAVQLCQRTPQERLAADARQQRMPQRLQRIPSGALTPPSGSR